MTGDTISRSHLLAEIAELKKSPWFNENYNGAKLVRKEAIELVEDLCIKQEPAVEPTRPSGRWVCDSDRERGIPSRAFDYHCSVCGQRLALCGKDITEHQKDGYHLYCGGCGADMRGGDG